MGTENRATPSALGDVVLVFKGVSIRTLDDLVVLISRVDGLGVRHSLESVKGTSFSCRCKVLTSEAMCQAAVDGVGFHVGAYHLPRLSLVTL